MYIDVSTEGDMRLTNMSDVKEFNLGYNVQNASGAPIKPILDQRLKDLKNKISRAEEARQICENSLINHMKDLEQLEREKDMLVNIAVDYSTPVHNESRNDAIMFRLIQMILTNTNLSGKPLMRILDEFQGLLNDKTSSPEVDVEVGQE
jgi:hypothetical protein